MSESSAEAVVSEFRFGKFGLLLRKLRTEAGVSQDGLAERAGISAKTVGALEQGARRAAHDDTIHRIADALQLPTTERDALFRAAQHSRARRPERAHETPQSNVPTSLTSFIERREVEAIAALLDGNRLVTIIGTGGVGKTRTAIEVARRTRDRSRSLWFIDLSRLRDSGAILSELVSALSITLSDADDPYARVVRHLNAHPARLLIDNCEHLLDGLADLIPRLVQSCPLLSILATSREPLSLSFETSYRLPSLDVPADRIATLDQALEYSALRLFLARTESGGATWLKKPASLEKIGQLCRKLDGIPLAIELVAPRVSTLGLDVVLQEITRGLTLSGRRDSPERHQTMTATIAWSYALLDATEQAVLRRLSVFAGSFRLDAAQRVCADHDIPAYTVVDACHRLAQKSLIVVEHGDTVRYRLLAAIRAFGESQLSPDESNTAHVNFIRWLRELADSVHYNQGGLAMKSMKPDIDNVRAGVDRCLERGGEADILDAAAIAGGFRLLWIETNHNRELKHYAEYLLGRVDLEKQAHLVSRLLLAVCSYSAQRDLPAATARAIPVLVADGNYSAAAGTLARLANYQFRSGDIEAARRSLGDAFEFLRDVDPAQNRQYWNCLMDRAWMSCAQGNITQASADLQLLATYLNDGTDPGRRERCKVQIVAAEIAFVCGDMPKAISLLSLELETSDSWTAVYKFQILTNLAVYHAVSGNGNTALQLTRTVLEEFGDRDWSLVSEEYQYILVPAAAAAVVHDRARLGAIILGHWKHYWLNGRVILATEAPAYEKVLELLRSQFSTDEMNQLFDAGAAVLPESVLEYVRSDRLFAPTPQTNTLQTEV